MPIKGRCATRSNVARRKIQQIRAGASRVRTDTLAAEEPLELRVIPAGASEHVQVAVTMRTPGHDFELAAGFLHTEGLLEAQGDQRAGLPERPIRSISYCRDVGDGAQQYNIVNVHLRAGVSLALDRPRNFYMSSSCGVCGKASLEAIRTRGVLPVQSDVTIDHETLSVLDERLRAAQALFDKTGGLHAAGLFTPDGTLSAIREDVGRHNAVDKLIGQALLAGDLPLHANVLMVSGRASFEIVQKAAAAGIPIIAAVSAPSSLACDAAAEFNMTLIGFLRGDRFNIYTGAERVRLGADD